MNKLFINFLLGGFIVSGTSWLGAFASPLIAALFWAYPFSLFPSIFFLQSQGKPNSYISKFLFSNVWGLILQAIILFSLSYFIHLTPTNESLLPAIGKASIIYVIGSALYYFIVKFFHLEKYFM